MTIVLYWELVISFVCLYEIFIWYPCYIIYIWGFQLQAFPLNHCANVCKFLWFHVCIAIDLISARDDHSWNRFCIVHEVKIVCDQENLGHIAYYLYNFYMVSERYWSKHIAIIEAVDFCASGIRNCCSVFLVSKLSIHWNVF